MAYGKPSQDALLTRNAKQVIFASGHGVIHGKAGSSSVEAAKSAALASAMIRPSTSSAPAIVVQISQQTSCAIYRGVSRMSLQRVGLTAGITSSSLAVRSEKAGWQCLA
eukprot:712309-Rhodomonas_salina.1